MAKFSLHLPLLLVAMGAVAMASVLRHEPYSGFVRVVTQYSDPPNIPALAKQLGLNTLVNYLGANGLTDTLSGPGPWTVFGPMDEAFTSMTSWLKRDFQDKTILLEVLKFHAVSGNFSSGTITNEAIVNTTCGKPLRFNIYPNNVMTAQCKVVDTAHVDQMASNGIVHVMKGVMVPPHSSAFDFMHSYPVMMNNFSTLVTAINAAGLADTLNGAGPFTIFAPSNKAFAKLNPDVLKNLLKDKTKLTNVLTYHVARGTNCSAGLEQIPHIDMMNGQQIRIKSDGGNFHLNGKARIVHEFNDMSVTNGVIHLIDTVLMPPGLY